MKLELTDNALKSVNGGSLGVNTNDQWQFQHGSFTRGYVKAGAADYGTSGAHITKAQLDRKSVV